MPGRLTSTQLAYHTWANSLNGTPTETALERAARFKALFTPALAGKLNGPAFNLLTVTSAFLGRLLEHRDYEAWAETDCDDTDGLLREIIRQAQALRPRLVAGIPDPPPGTEVYNRAQQLAAGDPGNARCYHLLASAVQAFEDAGLTDGDHFLGLAAHVWGTEV